MGACMFACIQGYWNGPMGLSVSYRVYLRYSTDSQLQPCASSVLYGQYPALLIMQ